MQSPLSVVQWLVGYLMRKERHDFAEALAQVAVSTAKHETLKLVVAMRPLP